MLGPGKLVSDPLDAISLGLALMFGTAGLPHILMRFYTVPDARTARVSVNYATAFIGTFYLLTFVLGFGAMVLVGHTAITAVDPGGNMAAPLLAEVVGGRVFLGFITAVAFATILAVVAGLTLAGAAALSHDLWINVVRGGQAAPHEELRVARISTVVLGVVSIGLGLAFKGQNVAYMVGLAFAIAASANFPALVLSVFWRRFTTRAAAASMVTGTVASLVLIYFSPTIQIGLLGHGVGAISVEEPRAGLDAPQLPGRDRRGAGQPGARGGTAVRRGGAPRDSRRNSGIVFRGLQVLRVLQTRFLVLAFVLCAASVPTRAQSPVEPQARVPAPTTRPVDFARDVKPILQVACVRCHARGNDKGGFSIETRESLLRGGDTGPAVVPGQSAESFLIDLVSGLEPDMVMPKKGSRLTADQIGVAARVDRSRRGVGPGRHVCARGAEKPGAARAGTARGPDAGDLTGGSPAARVFRLARRPLPRHASTTAS